MNQSPNRFSGSYLLLVLLIALAAAILVQAPLLWDKYRVVGDVQNMYRMARYQDPALFLNDPQGGFGAIDITLLGFPIVLYPRSLGYGLLFYPFSFVTDYIWLIKWIGLLLLLISALYLFKLGQHLGNLATALSLSLIFIFFMLAAPQSISVFSGLQRGFAVPLMIVFVYYMAFNRVWLAGASVIATTLIYLPNFPISILAYTNCLWFSTPRQDWLEPKSNAKLGAWLATVILSGLVIAFALAVELNLFEFAPSQATQLAKSPPSLLQSAELLHHAQGFAEMYFGFPFLGRAGLLDSGADAFNLIVLSLLGLLIYATLGHMSFRNLPPVLSHLLIASIVMYVLSLIAIFGFSSLALYLPSRYTRVTLFVVAICYVGLNWPTYLEKAPAWFRHRVRLVLFFFATLLVAIGIVYLVLPAYLPLLALVWFIGLIMSGLLTLFSGSYLAVLLMGKSRFYGARRAAVTLIATLITLFSARFYTTTLGLDVINPTPATRAVYAFLATLPKDMLVAGDPKLMQGVPLFSQRSVIFSALQPAMSAPIIDYFKAQYAESPGEVLAFCQHFRVDYLVVDVSHFDPDYLERGEFFFAPYNEVVVEMVSNRSKFVLPTVKPVFSSGPLHVLKCDPDNIARLNQ